MRERLIIQGVVWLMHADKTAPVRTVDIEARPHLASESEDVVQDRHRAAEVVGVDSLGSHRLRPTCRAVWARPHWPRQGEVAPRNDHASVRPIPPEVVCATTRFRLFSKPPRESCSTHRHRSPSTVARHRGWCCHSGGEDYPGRRRPCVAHDGCACW